MKDEDNKYRPKLFLRRLDDFGDTLSLKPMELIIEPPKSPERPKIKTISFKKKDINSEELF